MPSMMWHRFLWIILILPLLSGWGTGVFGQNLNDIFQSPTADPFVRQIPLNRDINPNSLDKKEVPGKGVLDPEKDNAKETPTIETELEEGGSPGVTQQQLEKLPTFFLKEVAIRGVTILDGDEVTDLITPWVGRTINYKQLQALADSITQQYHQQGYITTKAYIPSQTVANGRVIIQVIEGKIDGVIIKGRKRVRTSRIKGRLLQQEGDVLKVQLLQTGLVHLNQLPDVKTARATLKPGSTLGTSTLVIDLEEERNFHVQTNFDNQGRDSIDFFRNTLTLSHNSLLGFGDQFVASGLRSTSGRTNYMFLQYQIPLNKWGWTIGANMSRTKIQIKDLDRVTGTTTGFSLMSTLPLVKRDRWSLTGDVMVQSQISDIFLPIGPDSDLILNITDFTGLPNQNDIRPLTTGLTFSEQDSWGGTSLRVSTQWGLGNLGGKSTFFKFNGDAQRVQRLFKGVVGVARAQWQWSNDNLPGLAQYQLGGANSVRGLNEGFFVGDSGYLLSAELRFPFWKFPERIRRNWQGLLFLDYGGTLLTGPNRGINARGTPGFVTTYGAGVRGQLNKYLTVSADLGIVLDQVVDEADMRLHIRLGSLLF